MVIYIYIYIELIYTKLEYQSHKNITIAFNEIPENGRA